jgi:hypothetical protein
MSDTIQSTRPAWIDQWTNAFDDGRPYDDATIHHFRAFAHQRSDAMSVMLTYPPHCVISFKINGAVSHGLVTGVHLIQPDPPKKRKKRGLPDVPDKVIALRFVPSPLHLPCATSPDERESSYVLPEGVDVIGYSPRFTPETMRAFVCPAGCA